MKEKPFIVQLAEFLSGYSGTSKERDETLRHLQERAKSLNEELYLYKSKADEQSAKVVEAGQQIEHLENTIQEKDQKIGNLTEQLRTISDQYQKSLERCNTLSKDIEKLSNKQNVLVGYIMSGIQNSEIFSAETFPKAQVIQFLNAQLEQLLSALDIEIYEDVDVHVDPLFHKIEATKHCDNAAKEGYISRSLGKGFRIGGKCIQEQPVEIYTHNI